MALAKAPAPLGTGTGAVVERAEQPRHYPNTARASIKDFVLACMRAEQRQNSLRRWVNRRMAKLESVSSSEMAAWLTTRFPDIEPDDVKHHIDTAFVTMCSQKLRGPQ